MSVRVTDKTNVALYDSTTGVAFGPLFESEFDAYEFLEWLRSDETLDGLAESGDFGGVTYHGADPRQWAPHDLIRIHALWESTREIAAFWQSRVTS
jgi:hypothetical protein